MSRAQSNLRLRGQPACIEISLLASESGSTTARVNGTTGTTYCSCRRGTDKVTQLTRASRASGKAHTRMLPPETPHAGAYG
ncbi:hypothetical protein GCM10009733_088560 [Nonomuraea maheshkhaliensis]|uniref:DUF397 domain-containing protein n=1 Tax=Nonomuraea maheshkhaliensis TaxID=419590 RepID=A0ABN2GWF5_9ACTN